MAEKTEPIAKTGSIVKVNEKGEKGWHGCLLTISEINGTKAKASIRIPNQGDAYLELQTEQFDLISE